MGPETSALVADVDRVLDDGLRAAAKSRRLRAASEGTRRAAVATRRQMQPVHQLYSRVVIEAHRLCQPPPAGGG